MSIDRKEFLIIAAGAVLAGCRAATEGGAPVPPQAERIVDAGPASTYAADGVYSGYRNLGFFVVRNGERLFALSSVCTHRRCRISPEFDRSYSCPCHGSEFDTEGRVTMGPATRDLPTLQTSISEAGRLMVRVPAS